MKGKFITFEGCEGCGKSTHQRFLANYLAEHHYNFIFTREPGGNPISEQIRSLILDKNNTAITAECEALLYAASRAQVLSDVIAPALNEGKIVVCDRYVDSSFAYQGVARGLGMEFIEKINAFALERFMPDVTIFLDIPPKAAFERKHGADQNDRIEQAGLAFHEKVYEGYLTLAEKYPDRFFKINSNREKSEVHADILSLLKQKGIL